jgi:hypothetical protein
MSPWFLVVGEIAGLVRELFAAINRGDVQETRVAALNIQIAAEREAVKRMRGG